jgi:hypothetical protein
MNRAEAAGTLAALASKPTTHPDEREALNLAVRTLTHDAAPTEQQCETCGRILELAASICPCGSRDLRPVYTTTTRKP